MERFKGTAAVICEFNPFHHGHKHLLDTAKEKYGTVFGIMSGNLVQRGGNACADKYARAAAAVECGFDGVLELPFPFSGLSARDFARAGVHIAEETGIETLVFGAEDPEYVRAASEIICKDGFEEGINGLIKEQKRLSYPKAVELALAERLGEETASALCHPNNILALEYIKALSKRGILKYHIIRRSESFCSAGSLRASGVPQERLPEKASDFFQNTVPDGEILPYAAVAAKLYTGDKAVLYGIDESLAGRITKACRVAGDAKELTEKCRSANDTDARIRRALISILFGITKYQAAEMPSYILLLAAGRGGMGVIKEMGRKSGIEFGVKPASLTGNKQFEAALRAERVLRTLYGAPDPLCRTPYIQGALK